MSAALAAGRPEAAAGRTTLVALAAREMRRFVVNPVLLFAVVMTAWTTWTPQRAVTEIDSVTCYPAIFLGGFGMMATYWLTRSMRDSEPVVGVTPTRLPVRTAAMANLTGGFKTAAIASLPLDGIKMIVDVGGADGTVLAAILTAHPQLRGVLFDLPHVITDAPRTLARHGVQDRAECAGGDFLESVPPGGDAYLLSLVLHDWPDDQARRILANVAAAGGSGARLLVLDFMVPPGDAPHMAKISDLNMLAMMGGKERTETEWRELLTAAGFAGIGIGQTGTPFSVIQATAQ